MVDAIKHHCTRSWYMRPPVWVLGIIVLAIAVFGIIEMTGRPAALPYSEFLDQLDGGNVASVIFAGSRIEGNFKHPVGQAAVNGPAAQTSFHSQVPVFGDPVLLSELRKEHIPIAVTSSSSYWWGTSAVLGGLAAILLAKPMLLIIAAAFITGLVRVARGGKMEMKSTLAMLPMFRSFAQQDDKPKQSPGGSRHQADRRLSVKDEMTDAAQDRPKRAWYLRPVVWALAIAVVAFAVFGVVKMNKGPAAISYSDFFDQLDAGNVASVTFQGTEIDGRFKNPLNVAASNGAAQALNFRSRVPDFGDPTLIAELRKQQVVIDANSGSTWTGLLSGIPLPMLLMFGAIVVAGIFRLLQGKAGQTGRTMPMHPMQGMVGFVSGFFGRQDPPAHLPENTPTDQTPRP